MNALEKNFLRIVRGWAFVPTPEGFVLKSPISLSYTPKTVASFEVNLDDLSLKDVADLIHGVIPQANALNLHTSFELEDVENVLRSAAYPSINGWFEKVESLGIEVAASDNFFTKQLDIDPRFFSTQPEMVEAVKNCVAITLVPQPFGNWTVCERFIRDDYKIGGHPGSELLGWWSNGLVVGQGSVESVRTNLMEELELWLCKHPINF